VELSVQHSCKHIPPPTFLLQVVEALQNDTFPVGETVSDVGKMLTRVTGRHMKVSPAESTQNSVLSIAVVLNFCNLPKRCEVRFGRERP
jgi:hypothetical protein